MFVHSRGDWLRQFFGLGVDGDFGLLVGYVGGRLVPSKLCQVSPCFGRLSKLLSEAFFVSFDEVLYIYPQQNQINDLLKQALRFRMDLFVCTAQLQDIWPSGPWSWCHWLSPTNAPVRPSATQRTNKPTTVKCRKIDPVNIEETRRSSPNLYR